MPIGGTIAALLRVKMKLDNSALLLIALLIAGLCFEGIKRLDGVAPHVHISPHAAQVLTESVSTPHPSAVGTHLHPAPTGPLAVKAPAVAAAVTKPAVAAKKKKDDKKKKEETKTKAKTTSPTEQAKTKSDATPSSFMGGGVGGAGASASSTIKTNTNPVTLQDWENLILSTPSYANTMKLVAAYLSQQISADTFYTVVNEMLIDGRGQMQSLGVIALGATPSASSFSDLETNYSSGPQSGAVKSLMNTALSEYSTPQNMPILLQVALSGQTQQLQIEALQRIQTAVQSQILQHHNSVSTAGAGRGSRGTTSTSSIAGLQNVTVVLNTLIKEYPHSAVGQQALSTLQTIQQLQRG